MAVEENAKNDFMQRFMEVFHENTKPEEMQNFYNEWAIQYDQDMLKHDYLLVNEATEKIIEDLKRTGASKDIEILDVGAGTGAAGHIFKRHGYHNVDAIDYSQEMLAVAIKAGIYRKAFHEYIGKEKLPIDSNSYDLTLLFGCIGHGHVHNEAFNEIIRLTKRDGHVWFSLEHGENPEVTKVQELEQSGVIKVVEKPEFNFLKMPGSDKYEKCLMYICKKL